MAETENGSNILRTRTGERIQGGKKQEFSKNKNWKEGWEW
jgi:hypothetical protein